MRQDIADETVDSILVKEGRLEITFLFHANCLISQCCFYQNHDSIHIKIYDFLLVFRFFFHGKIRLRPKKRVESVYTFSGILTIHLYFGRRKRY